DEGGLKDSGIKDKELFDKIANKYAEKDLYSVSKAARKFQIDSLIKLIDPVLLEKKFDKVIEIGCGNGANSVYLKNYYNSYLGIDFSEELIKIANYYYQNEQTDFFSSDIKDLDKNIKYDLIVCVGVLHHLPNLKKYLRNIREIGHNDSVYAFLEPLAENPIIQLLRYFRKKIDPDYSKSQIFFKINELKKVFPETGFKITKLKYTGYLTPPFAQVILKPKFVFLPVVKLFIFFDKLIQKYCPNRLSWNISFIARKSE
ncbi:MAG: methyltransferase domain-containing protein, partial [Spirochaetes bacterium]|nr:methyltransferase domain-containing protein [Spirochaetota bacterium]